MPPVRFQRLPHALDLPLPSYASEGASGMDLRAALAEEMVIDVGAVALVPTGFAIELPKGFEGQIRARSGLALKHRIVVVNGPGTIDWDYRGELKVILGNFGPEPFRINHGDRIAQMVIAPVSRHPIEEAESLNDTDRGKRGFGSTGIL